MALLGGSAGPMEIIVIFLLVLVLFGPKKLPEIARMIGKTLHGLRQASEDFKDQVLSIDTEPDDDEDMLSVREIASEDAIDDGLDVDGFPSDDTYEDPYLETENMTAEGGNLCAADAATDKDDKQDTVS